MRLRRGTRVALVASASAVIALAGCGGDGSSPNEGEEPELVVFAAASLAPAFEELGSRFEGADVKFSFAGSDGLAAQIRQGVSPDIYAAASMALPDELYEEGLTLQPREFATNRLVAAVPTDSEIESLSQLEQSGLKIAIGDPAVPVGIYTREVLSALGATAAEAILGNVASEEPDVGGIVGKLTQGAVDAGFIYGSDVDASGGAVRAIEIPASASPDIAYGVAVGTGASQPDLAEEFADDILSGAGQQVLQDFGFEPAP